jgi:hypothetical protein
MRKALLDVGLTDKSDSPQESFLSQKTSGYC